MRTMLVREDGRGSRAISLRKSRFGHAHVSYVGPAGLGIKVALGRALPVFPMLEVVQLGHTKQRNLFDDAAKVDAD